MQINPFQSIPPALPIQKKFLQKNLSSTEKLNVPNILQQKNTGTRSLGCHIFKWLKNFGQRILNLFKEIFCCYKKDEIVRDPEGVKSCREILKGVGANIQMVPVLAGGGPQGTVLMPSVFSIDLHRISQLLLNGQKIYSNENATPEVLDQCCQRLFKKLGKEETLAASRLLNQVGFASAYIYFMQRQGNLEKMGKKVTQCPKSQLEVKLKKNQTVDLKIKYVFLVEDSIHSKVSYIGVESNYNIAKKELAVLGAMSPEELQGLDLEKVAPSAKSQYIFTKDCPSLEKAQKILGIIQ